MTAMASAPGRTRAPRATPSVKTPALPARPRPPREPRGLLAVALIASVLLHLIALLLFRFEAPSLASGPAPPVARSDEGVMRAYRIQPVQGGDIAIAAPEPVVVQERTPAVRFPDAAVESPALEPARRAAEPAPLPSAADRLSGRAVDPRLFAPPRDAGVSPDAMVRDRLANRLGAWNDSMASAADAAARARDWTVTDGDGNRWGVSPQGIHLGAITIPLGYSSTGELSELFQPPPDRRDEVNARLREWNEIQQQATRAEIRATFNERVKAIRERKDAERAKREGVKKSGGN